MAKKKTKKIKEKKVKLGKSKETVREKMIGQHIGKNMLNIWVGTILIG